MTLFQTNIVFHNHWFNLTKLEYYWKVSASCFQINIWKQANLVNNTKRLVQTIKWLKKENRKQRKNEFIVNLKKSERPIDKKNYVLFVLVKKKHIPM